MKKLWFVLILVFILVLSIVITGAKENKLNKVEQKVINELQKEGKARVIVFLEDSTAKSEKKISEFRASQRNEIKAKIDSTKIKYDFSYSNAFSASLSAEDIEILSLDENVKQIYYDKPVRAFLQDSVPLINATEAWGLQSNGVNLTGEGETVCIIDSGVDYTHPDLGNCTPVKYALNGTNESYALESTHPYTDNFDYIWNITMPGYSQIGVHFKNLSLECAYDYLSVMNGNGKVVGVYSCGDIGASNFWSPSVDGDTIYVRLKSDVSGMDYGFYIDQVVNGTTNTTYDWSNCSKVVGGWDVYNYDPDPMDDYGHGTHVAGIVAANGAIMGVAPDAKIISIKALGSGGKGYTGDIAAGIEWCTNRSEDFNISVISMSLGGGLNSTYCDTSDPIIAAAINSAVAKNIAVVVAAGNGLNNVGPGRSDQIAYPACIQNATPVSATTKGDVIDTSYADRSPLMLQLLAPGSDINSTILGGGYSGNTWSGTSMATPHVAGAFAIINQFLKSNGKTKTPQEIESIFNATGKIIYDSSSGLNYSRINIYDAIMSIDITPPNVSLISPAEGYSATGTTTVLFEYNVTDFLNMNSCALVLNGVISAYNSSGIGITNSTNNISSSLSAGSYSWSINCTDLAGNIGNSSTRSLTINSVSSSGGGGGSSSKIPEITNTALSVGYSTTLSGGDKVKFQSNGEDHTLKTNSVGANFADITIQSSPINLKLFIGESRKLNLSSNDYYDFYVKLESIKSGKANITLKSIYEKMIIEEIVKPELEANKTNVTSTVEKNNISTPVPENKTASRLPTYAIVIIGLCLILIVVYWILKIRRIKRYGYDLQILN